MKMPKIKSATLLSAEEAETLLTQEERKYTSWWWLRSPSNHRSYALAAGVRYDGKIHYYGYLTYCECDNVRPVLKINLKSSGLKVGDTFDFGERKFKIISNNLAFCLTDIGTSCFRKDWKANNANDYKKSDVKKFIDEWFEQQMKNYKKGD